MKIALIHTPLTTPTGGEKEVLMLAVELQKRGHDVEIFTNEADRENCFPDLFDQARISVVPGPIGRLPYPLNHILPYYKKFLGMRRIGKVVAKGKFDVACNANFPSEWAVHYLRKKAHIPTVWMCNEPPFWFFLPEERSGVRTVDWPLFELFDRQAVRSVDRIMVLSRLMQGLVEKIYGRSSQVVRIGIDVTQFEGVSGEPFRKKYGLEGSFIMLQTGQFSPYKRHEDSISALNILSKKYDNIKLLFIGPETGYKNKLLDMISAYGLQDKVLFLGACQDDELKRAYSACDIFLFPAHQSWSLVALEAMASGRPTIISDKCGASEIIEPGVNGFVMKHEDCAEMAGYIERLILDPKLKETIGNNAHATVSEKLTWKQYTDDMERAFQKAIAETKGPTR